MIFWLAVIKERQVWMLNGGRQERTVQISVVTLAGCFWHEEAGVLHSWLWVRCERWPSTSLRTPVRCGGWGGQHNTTAPAPVDLHQLADLDGAGVIREPGIEKIDGAWRSAGKAADCCAVAISCAGHGGANVWPASHTEGHGRANRWLPIDPLSGGYQHHWRALSG